MPKGRGSEISQTPKISPIKLVLPVSNTLWKSVTTAAVLATGLVACAEDSASPPAISLVRTFDSAVVTGSPQTVVEHESVVFALDDRATVEPAEDSGELRGWRALHDVANLRAKDGAIAGRVTGEDAMVVVPVPEGSLPNDLLGAVDVQFSIDKGTKIGVMFMRESEVGQEEIDELVEFLDDTENQADLVVDLEPGEGKSVRLTDADSPVSTSNDLGRVGHLGILFFGAEGAEFEIESVTIESRSQVLAGIPAGVGWHGLGNVFRETVVSRSPEQLEWTMDLGEQPWFDVAVGGPEPHPATYRIEVAAVGAAGGEPVTLNRSITENDRWHPLTLDLDALAGQTVTVKLAMETEEEGRIGFWGSPAIRHRGALPEVAEPTDARAALSDKGAPRGVIVLLADTLRSDHLDSFGYELRETAPELAEFFGGGVRFRDNISQGTWTKVAVPAILSSLYASTHGITDIPHRLPASVTTMAESFRDAGYTTFHTSSVMFSGRNSNLQQGVEVLHERSSVRGLDDYPSKTARVYVDRLIDWLEVHKDQPFFVFLHVFDPHSPFRPRAPYDRRWLEDEALANHEGNLEKVKEHVEIFHGLPSAEELKNAEVDADEFVHAERAWYDASIRAMDAEISRLFERLEEWGMIDDTLFALIADHGEEFLEHGYSWHGHSVYGEMINVPMAVRWPGVVPSGVEVLRTTQSIDLMPTLLELARVPIPDMVQGRSLVGLMQSPEDPSSYGNGRAPVFSERMDPPGESDENAPDAYAVILDGWKLIWNVTVRDDRPEFELFNHSEDPLNANNLAEQQPDRVEQLKRLIEGWRTQAEAARVSDEGLEEGLSPEEIRELKALGYLN